MPTDPWPAPRPRDAVDRVVSAVGGENVGETVEGLQRFPINVRYPRELREDLSSLSRVLVPTMSGAQVPLGQLADIRLVTGPSMIRNENGLLNGYVLLDFDTAQTDVGTYVKRAKAAVEGLQLPPGYSLTWSGQFENMLRVQERLALILPLTLVLIFGLIWMNTRSAAKTWIVVLSVPFSAVGAFWLLYLLGYNMSIAVWVGLIALLGIDAETGVFMLLYLDIAYEQAKKEGRLRSLPELRAAVLEGAVTRLRPKFMTTATLFLGLIPIMWSVGTGADVMKRIAAPMIGGVFTSFLLELIVYPILFELWKWQTEVKKNVQLSICTPD